MYKSNASLYINSLKEMLTTVIKKLLRNTFQKIYMEKVKYVK